MCCMTMLALNHPNLLPNCFDVNVEHVNIVCHDAQIDGSECQATCFTGDWDLKKDPKALPLPPSSLPAYPTVGKMMTSGYLIKFILFSWAVSIRRQSRCQVIRELMKSRRLSREETDLQIKFKGQKPDCFPGNPQNYGPPMVAHAQQSDHLPAKGGW